MASFDEHALNVFFKYVRHDNEKVVSSAVLEFTSRLAIFYFLFVCVKSRSTTVPSVII